MAKDALGHGSNGRGGSGGSSGKKTYKPIPDHPYHKMSDMQLRYIQKDAHEAGRNAQEMGDTRGVNKYADQVNDASTVLGYRARSGAAPDGSNEQAARALGQGGAKSGAVPVHDSFNTGDHVHLGFGVKGGAGFYGTLNKIEGGVAHITGDGPHGQFGPKTYSGSVSKLSRA